MKLEPKAILEGTRLTHKTDIAFALNEHPRIVGPRKYRCHSPLISGHDQPRSCPRRARRSAEEVRSVERKIG